MGRKPGRSLIVVFGVAGFVSALLVISARLTNILGYFVPGALLGAALSACLWFCGAIRPLWKLLFITAVSAISLPISGLIGAYLEYFSPFPLHTVGTGFANVSNTSLFAGGAVGAFLLLTAVFTAGSEEPMAKVLFRALCWSLAGGVLAVVGWHLGPWLGAALWYDVSPTLPNDTLETAALQGRTGIDSLLLVWQTGMGFVLGIALMASPFAE